MSSTWYVPGGGRVAAHADWSGTPTLALAVSCPGGPSTQEQGPPPLATVVTASGAVTCEVTLSEPALVHSSVSYTVTIDPPPPG